MSSNGFTVDHRGGRSGAATLRTLFSQRKLKSRMCLVYPSLNICHAGLTFAGTNILCGAARRDAGDERTKSNSNYNTDIESRKLPARDCLRRRGREVVDCKALPAPSPRTQTVANIRMGYCIALAEQSCSVQTVTCSMNEIPRVAGIENETVELSRYPLSRGTARRVEGKLFLKSLNDSSK